MQIKNNDSDCIDNAFLHVFRCKLTRYLSPLFCFFLTFLLLFTPLLAKSEEKTEKTEVISEEKGYTINFNSISIAEYIKFIGKICNVNFLFNETDLNFSVSVVSERPTSSTDLMTTLVQILRIHGLTLLEQDNNLVIHKSPGVKQFGKITTGEDNISIETPIVTRIFRIENVSAIPLVDIIKPMISTVAQLELFAETKQIIVTDVTANVEKIAEFIKIIDSPINPLKIEIYHSQENSPTELIKLTEQIMMPMAGANPLMFVAQENTDSIYIISTPSLIKQTLSVISNLDKPTKKINRNISGTNVFIYKTFTPTEFVKESLNSIAEGLVSSGFKETGLIETIQDMKIIHITSSIIFTGSPSTITQLKEILTSIDNPAEKGEEINISQNFFIYSSVNKLAKELASGLKQIANNFKKMNISDTKLISAIENLRLIEKINSLIFSTDIQTYSKIKELLSHIDTKTSQAMQENSFLIYPTKNISQRQAKSILNEMAQHLKESGQPNKELILTLESIKALPQTNTIFFTGDANSLQKIGNILKVIDIPKTGSDVDSFFLYQPLYLSSQQIEKYFEEISTHLSKSDINEHDLIEALKNASWLEDSNSFIINGSSKALDEIKVMLKSYDTEKELKKIQNSSNYYLYKLKFISGKDIEEDLESFSKKLKSQGIKQTQLLEVLENIKWVKETNSLLLTGDPLAIEEAKLIIAQFDIARNDKSIAAHEDFFMYKPQHLSAPIIEKSLADLSDNLKKSELADPNLLHAINNMQYVESSNSIVFTGNKESLDKVKNLLSMIDSTNGSSKKGKATVLVYKIQHASAQQLANSIRSIATDLEKGKMADKAFIAALTSMKYDQNINSLIFTGSPQSLDKITPLLKKFDMPSTSIKQEGPSEFYIYKPQYITGPSLEVVLKDFINHLKITGFSNQQLFNTIDSMKFEAKTNSIIFSGDQKSIVEIKSLLETFDVPSDGEEGRKSSIQAIEKTSFLVYKLQYHKGDEIQAALKQISADLSKSNASIQQSLLSAINSIQWIKVTNSLLCSGDQHTMTRLKDLIKNLDIPLKQVFIEILVVETSFRNMLTFGLNWASRFKYKNKFTSNMTNIRPNNTNDPSDFPMADDTFGGNLNKINATTTPKGTDIPFSAGGFDLGIIGDIIMHKGQSFISLGSLLEALEQDVESTIVMTPKIIAQDSKTSNIFIGQNIPYIGSDTQISSLSTKQQITQNLEYKDVGMSLIITPVLGNTDTVTLDIKLDKSTIIPNDPQTTSAVLGITTTKTTMNTTVHVPNKSFLVLSGNTTDQKDRGKTGIPCLGGLPLVGAAFTVATKDNTRDNLVIFIRPHIINSYKDMMNISQAQEDYFRENTGTATLERDYEESTELIKSIDIDNDYDYEDEDIH